MRFSALSLQIHLCCCDEDICVHDMIKVSVLSIVNVQHWCWCWHNKQFTTTATI